MGSQIGSTAADANRTTSSATVPADPPPQPVTPLRSRHTSESATMTQSPNSPGTPPNPAKSSRTSVGSPPRETPLDSSVGGVSSAESCHTVIAETATAERKVPVVFRYGVQGTKVKDVFVIGSFTEWVHKVPMIKTDCDFLAIIELPEGTHQYKFVADGKWECSSSEPTMNDGFSGLNNVVVVRESDFDVMSALKVDAQMCYLKSRSGRDNKKNKNEALSPHAVADDDDSLRQYTDELPPKAYANLMDQAPALPPHLMNILLNKNTASHCEPTLLPEPNHVMLQHLYALSIRDGVLVLSTTSRFREKYVTTCFYKPMDSPSPPPSPPDNHNNSEPL